MRPGIDALKSLGFFAALEAETLSRLNDQGDLARIGPGEVLFRNGDRLDDFHILLSGFIALTNSRGNGQDSVTGIAAPVKPLAFAASLRGDPAPTGARTVTSVRLIILPAADLRAMIGANPALAPALLDYALTATQELQQEICHLKLRSSAQRLSEYLLGLAGDPAETPARFVLPFEKQFLAGKIGCSQENLSRAFAALRKLGVETQRGVVVLKDVPALRRFAGQG